MTYKERKERGEFAVLEKYLHYMKDAPAQVDILIDAADADDAQLAAIEKCMHRLLRMCQVTTPFSNIRDAHVRLKTDVKMEVLMDIIYSEQKYSYYNVREAGSRYQGLVFILRRNCLDGVDYLERASRHLEHLSAGAIRVFNRRLPDKPVEIYNLFRSMILTMKLYAELIQKDNLISDCSLMMKETDKIMQKSYEEPAKSLPMPHYPMDTYYLPDGRRHPNGSLYIPITLTVDAAGRSEAEMKGIRNVISKLQQKISSGVYGCKADLQILIYDCEGARTVQNFGQTKTKEELELLLQPSPCDCEKKAGFLDVFSMVRHSQAAVFSINELKGENLYMSGVNFIFTAGDWLLGCYDETESYFSNVKKDVDNVISLLPGMAASEITMREMQKPSKIPFIDEAVDDESCDFSRLYESIDSYICSMIEKDRSVRDW